MNDAQRYRMNAAECISAAERCDSTYRDLTFDVAEAWLSLARQQQAIDELLGIWGKALSATSMVPSQQSLQYPPNLHRVALPAPARDVASVQLGCWPEGVTSAASYSVALAPNDQRNGARIT
jgi:hypothetical protein